MRLFLSRRNLVIFISGVLTLAVVTIITLNISQRQLSGAALAHTNIATPTGSVQYSVFATPTTTSSQPSQTATPPPTNTNTAPTPTPFPTPSGSGSGHGVTPPYNPDPTPTPSPTLTPTPSPTSTPTPGATPTPTTPAAPVNDSVLVDPQTPQTISRIPAAITVQFVMENTGNTTWSVPDYSLMCVSTCAGGQQVTGPNQPYIFQTTAPNQALSFLLDFPLSAPWVKTSYASQWALAHDGLPFGQTVTIHFTLIEAIELGTDAAPGCDSSGMSWSLSHGSTCANGGLVMTTNSTGEPRAALQSGPAGFNDANYRITFLVSAASNTGAWVRIIGYNAGSACTGQGMDIQPSGQWRDVHVLNCVETAGPWESFSGGSKQVAMGMVLQNGSFEDLISYSGFIEEGGTSFSGGYPVISVGGPDGTAFTITGVELDTPAISTTYSVS